MLRFKKFAAVVAVAAFGCAANAGAAGAGMATEMTQMLNNVELAKVSADSSTTAITTVNKYMLQIQQYKNQLANTMGMDPSTLSASIADANRGLNALSNYKASLTSLNGSLSAQTSMMDSRLTEARLLNLPWSEYVKRVAQDAQYGNSKAQARLQNEENILAQVNSDYAYAQQQYSQIPAAVGQEQSLQILNSQMNRVVTQNAQIIAILAKAHNSDVAEKESRQAEEKARATAIYDSYIKQRQSLADRQKQEAGY